MFDTPPSLFDPPAYPRKKLPLAGSPPEQAQSQPQPEPTARPPLSHRRTGQSPPAGKHHPAHLQSPGPSFTAPAKSSGSSLLRRLPCAAEPDPASIRACAISVTGTAAADTIHCQHSHAEHRGSPQSRTRFSRSRSPRVHPPRPVTHGHRSARPAAFQQAHRLHSAEPFPATLHTRAGSLTSTATADTTHRQPSTAKHRRSPQSCSSLQKSRSATAAHRACPSRSAEPFPVTRPASATAASCPAASGTTSRPYGDC